MSRLQSSVHNFGKHAISGMSDFISELYAYAENMAVWCFEVDVTPEKKEYIKEAPISLQNTIDNLRKKLRQIFESTAGISPSDITYAAITVDFMIEDNRILEKKKALQELKIWYGHEPVFQAEVNVKLKDGRKCCKKITQK